MAEKEELKGAVIIEGHVQGLSNTRSLGEAGIPVIVVDKSNCIARYSRYCKGFYYSPDFEGDGFADFLISLGKREGLDGWLLMPSNDHAVHTISRNRSLLNQIYKTITPGPEIIDKIYDKKTLLHIAQNVKIPCPPTQYFKSPEDKLSDDLHLPVLTRGRFGLSFYRKMKVKAFLAQTEKELHDQLTFIESEYDLEKSVTQELIPSTGLNHTVSFTAYCVNGEIKCHWVGQKLREHPWRFGTATLAESIDGNICLESSVKLLRELNYSGICEIEYLRDPRDGEYKLIEINARTWLWTGLAKACGVNYALLAYKNVNGQPAVFPETYRTDLKWINWLTDTWFSLKAIFRGRLGLREYLMAMKGKRIKAVFSGRDPMPSLALIFLSFYIALKRG
jgi:D-aspartate ligase